MVMNLLSLLAQALGVVILAEFHPRIVRMAGAVEVDPEEGN